MTPEVYAKAIYNNYLFDIPKIFDLCVLYKKNQLLPKMIDNLFKTQQKYYDDFKTSVKDILSVHNIHNTIQLWIFIDPYLISDLLFIYSCLKRLNKIYAKPLIWILCTTLRGVLARGKHPPFWRSKTIFSLFWSSSTTWQIFLLHWLIWQAFSARFSSTWWIRSLSISKLMKCFLSCCYQTIKRTLSCYFSIKELMENTLFNIEDFLNNMLKDSDSSIK